tara:strand:- start:9536 stop:10093 length:558 start_codon:yes stop_codon:yes gene_type:complete
MIVNLNLPESIMIYIFSFIPSFEFYKNCKHVLLYDTTTSVNVVGKYYFNTEINNENVRKNKNKNNDLIANYLFLDYFLFHRHLLILDGFDKFEKYLYENHWVRDLWATNPTNKTIHESLRNIMRLLFFVNCLREIGRHQRQMTKDKLEQTNIGISFQCLIENIYKESEDQTKILKCYIADKKIIT